MFLILNMEWNTPLTADEKYLYAMKILSLNPQITVFNLFK